MEFQNIRQILAQVSVVGLASGILYLWAYWSKFRINVFSYAGILDLANSAIIPLGISLASVLIGVIQGYVVSSSWMWVADLKTGRSKTKLADRIRIFFSFPETEKKILKKMFMILHLMILVIIWHAPISPLLKPVLFASLFAAAAFFPVKESGFLSEISNVNVRFILIFTLLAAPGYSYLRSSSDAESLLTGE